MKDTEGTVEASWVNDILDVRVRNLFSVAGKIEHKDMVVDLFSVAER